MRAQKESNTHNTTSMQQPKYFCFFFYVRVERLFSFPNWKSIEYIEGLCSKCLHKHARERDGAKENQSSGKLFRETYGSFRNKKTHRPSFSVSMCKASKAVRNPSIPIENSIRMACKKNTTQPHVHQAVQIAGFSSFEKCNRRQNPAHNYLQFYTH